MHISHKWKCTFLKFLGVKLPWEILWGICPKEFHFCASKPNAQEVMARDLRPCCYAFSQSKWNLYVLNSKKYRKAIWNCMWCSSASLSSFQLHKESLGHLWKENLRLHQKQKPNSCQKAFGAFGWKGNSKKGKKQQSWVSMRQQRQTLKFILKNDAKHFYFFVLMFLTSSLFG